MTNAEKAKNLSAKHSTVKAELRELESVKFAHKIANTKIHKRAVKGHRFCKTKVKHGCSAVIVAETLSDMGYVVTRKYGLFGASLRIKW